MYLGQDVIDGAKIKLDFDEVENQDVVAAVNPRHCHLNLHSVNTFIPFYIS